MLVPMLVVEAGHRWSAAIRAQFRDQAVHVRHVATHAECESRMRGRHGYVVVLVWASDVRAELEFCATLSERDPDATLLVVARGDQRRFLLPARELGVAHGFVEPVPTCELFDTLSRTVASRIRMVVATRGRSAVRLDVERSQDRPR